MASNYPRVAGLPSFGLWDHFRISLYWFGANFIWGAFLGPLLSSQMTVLAPEHTTKMIGLVTACAAFPAILVPLMVGPFSDRCRSKWGRRSPFIFWGALIAVLGILGMAAAFNSRSIPGYIAGYFLIQIGSNTALAAYSGVIPDLVPRDQRGVASGMMAVMSQLGTLAGALTAGLIFQGGVQCLYVMAGILGAFALFTALTLREQPLPAPPSKQDWGQYFKSLWIDPRKFPDFAWVWLTRALMMLGFYMIQPFIMQYLRDVAHVHHPESEAAKVFGVILIGATISGILGGRLSDQIGRKKVVIYSTYIISVMALVFIGLNNLTQALVAGMAFGVGYGAYISVDWALGTDVLPKKEDAASDMAVWHIAMTLPQVIAAPLAGGLILDHFISGHIAGKDGANVATYQTSGYAIVFGVAAVLFFFSGILVRKVNGST